MGLWGRRRRPAPPTPPPSSVGEERYSGPTDGSGGSFTAHQITYPRYAIGIFRMTRNQMLNQSIGEVEV
jgi:hypothetical protein